MDMWSVAYKMRVTGLGADTVTPPRSHLMSVDSTSSFMTGQGHVRVRNVWLVTLKFKYCHVVFS